MNWEWPKWGPKSICQKVIVFEICELSNAFGHTGRDFFLRRAQEELCSLSQRKSLDVSQNSSLLRRKKTFFLWHKKTHFSGCHNQRTILVYRSTGMFVRRLQENKYKSHNRFTMCFWIPPQEFICRLFDWSCRGSAPQEIGICHRCSAMPWVAWNLC